MIRSFRDLKVYQKAYILSLELHRLSLGFPDFEKYELASQLRRASKSVCFNIAEGNSRKDSLADFKRFLTIALGSNDEARSQLDYCKDLGYISPEQYQKYESESVEIAKLLSYMLKNWKTNH